jgi:pyruvate/2-oxoglutarate dehydrogenase complex dihydrolipoamide acyltransferase (E2) component
MSDLQEKAMRMALEALHNIDQSNNDDAIEALRQALAESANSTTNFVEPKALAQPEQEPVAWMEKNVLPLTHIIKAVVRREQDEQYTVPLYTAPPKRDWKGLTSDDKHFLLANAWDSFMEAIDKFLEEKNT